MQISDLKENEYYVVDFIFGNKPATIIFIYKRGNSVDSGATYALDALGDLQVKFSVNLADDKFRKATHKEQVQLFKAIRNHERTVKIEMHVPDLRNVHFSIY